MCSTLFSFLHGHEMFCHKFALAQCAGTLSIIFPFPPAVPMHFLSTCFILFDVFACVLFFFSVARLARVSDS